MRRAGGWEQTSTPPNILEGKRAKNNLEGRRDARGEKPGERVTVGKA